MIEDSECPHCGAALSEAAILTSFLENIAHTSAIASANKFIALDLAVVPFLLVNLLLAFAEYPLWIRAGNLVCYAGVMVLIGRWFYHYWYRIRYSDPEYLEALSRMKRLLLIRVCGQAIIWGALVAEFFSAS